MNPQDFTIEQHKMLRHEVMGIVAETRRLNGVSPRGLTITLLLPLDRSTILTWQDRHDSNMQGRFIM